MTDAILAELRSPGARKYYPPGFTAYLDRCDTVLEHSANVGGCVVTVRVFMPASDATPVFRQSVKRLFHRAATLVSDPFFGIAARRSALTVNIVPSPARRMFPAPGEPIGPENLNGGFTYVPMPMAGTGAAGAGGTADIYILRREEMAKVTLHELIHHSRVHTDDAAWNPILPEIYRVFGIQTAGCPHACTTDIRPNEALVEFWATLYHSKCLSKEYNIPLATLVAAERDHAIAQAAHLEAHRRTLATGAGNAAPLWNERTHAYSYIRLRALMLADLPGFIAAFPEPPYDPVAVGRWLIKSITKKPAATGNHTYTHNSSLKMTLLGNI
jgi:hypothetical protein